MTSDDQANSGYTGPVYGEAPRYGYQHPDPTNWAPTGGDPSATLSGYLPPVQQPYQQGYLQSYAPVFPYAPVYAYAPWIRRVGAFLIDFAPTLIAQIPFYVGYFSWLIALTRQSGSGATTVPTDGLIWMAVGGLALLPALGWHIYNRWLVAGRTGQSLGKRILKTKLVAESTGQPIGPLNAFIRDLVHFLDRIALVGYLWPLWDRQRQTFADKLMRTVVIDSPASPPSPAE